MQYVAESKNIKMSPRKVRLVAEGIKKFNILSALSYLNLSGKRAAIPVRKTIESAIANAVNNFKAKKEDLFIKEIQIGEGVSYKRYHYAARGRVRPYKKRTSHVKVVLEAKNKELKNIKQKEEIKTAVKGKKEGKTGKEKKS